MVKMIVTTATHRINKKLKNATLIYKNYPEKSWKETVDWEIKSIVFKEVIT